MPVSHQTVPGWVNAFCCGPGYDTTNGTCMFKTFGSSQPFKLTAGKIIYNRTSGSIFPNTTTTVTSTATAATTTTATNTLTAATVLTTSTATPAGSFSSKDAVALGTGLGFPLGLALLASLGMLWREKRYNRRLKRYIDDRCHGDLTKLPNTNTGSLVPSSSGLVSTDNGQQLRGRDYVHEADVGWMNSPPQLDSYDTVELDSRVRR